MVCILLLSLFEENHGETMTNSTQTMVAQRSFGAHFTSTAYFERVIFAFSIFIFARAQKFVGTPNDYV